MPGVTQAGKIRAEVPVLPLKKAWVETNNLDTFQIKLLLGRLTYKILDGYTGLYPVIH